MSNVSFHRLRALARGLGVPEDEVVAVARGKFPRSKSEAMGKQLLDYFNELPEDAQRHVLYMVRGLLEEMRVGHLILALVLLRPAFWLTTVFGLRG